MAVRIGRSPAGRKLKGAKIITHGVVKRAPKKVIAILTTTINQKFSRLFSNRIK